MEEALASLIVDNQDKYHALQYRALVTYVKRVYHPFLMCEPQVGGSARAGAAAYVRLLHERGTHALFVCICKLLQACGEWN